jgi:hypothetical protein
MNKKKIMSAIKALAAGVKSNAKLIKENQQAISKLIQRFEVLNEHSDYLDRLTTELSHALPDSEYDAKCEAQEADIDASLDRHRERLGLRKPRPPLINSLSRRGTGLGLSEPLPFLCGSELTKKLLEAQRYVIASVSDRSDGDARQCGNNKLIISDGFEDGCFTDDMGGTHYFAVPLDVYGCEITELPSIDLKPGDVLLREDWHDYFEEGARYIVTDDLRVKDLQGDEWPFLRKTKDLYVFGLNDATTACFVKAEDAVHG